MLTIGLTGGIGSGKSTVAKIFRDLGAAVASADEISHQLIKKGTPVYHQICQRFNPILTSDDEIDRQQLRKIIFNCIEKKRWLEQLLHPILIDKLRQFVDQSQLPYCVLEIPLLLETKPDIEIHRILVVDSPKELQIARAEKRPGISPIELKQIIAKQFSRKMRLKYANDIIDNSGSLADLKEKVLSLHNFYLDLANKKT